MFSNVPCGIENRYFSRYCHKVRNVIIVTKQIRIMLAMKVLKAIFDFCFFVFFWTNRFTLLLPSLYLLMCDLSLHAIFFNQKSFYTQQIIQNVTYITLIFIKTK